jgi:hypothetical protein
MCEVLCYASGSMSMCILSPVLSSNLAKLQSPSVRSGIVACACTAPGSEKGNKDQQTRSAPKVKFEFLCFLEPLQPGVKGLSPDWKPAIIIVIVIT